MAACSTCPTCPTATPRAIGPIGPRGPFYGFSEDATQAMATNPGYFAAWYSLKSILLVGAVAALAYQLGKKR